MKIVLWNVNLFNVCLLYLEQWFKDFGLDIVGIQEIKLEDYKFFDLVLIGVGYCSVFVGQKIYNGVVLLLCELVQDVQIGIFGFEDEQKCVIVGIFGDLWVINLYVVNGQDIGIDKYDYKLCWLEVVYVWIVGELQWYLKLIVMGDFNIVLDVCDVYDLEVWNDNYILIFIVECGVFNKLLQLGLYDGFCLYNDEVGIFSWWDYCVVGFCCNLGLCIDLILVFDVLKSGVVVLGIDCELCIWECLSDYVLVWVQIG